MMKRLPDHAILGLLEGMIEASRAARSMPAGSIENLRYRVLVQVAEDMRARSPKRAGTAQVAIRAALDGFERSKCPLGYDRDAGMNVATTVLGHWLIIKR